MHIHFFFFLSLFVIFIISYFKGNNISKENEYLNWSGPNPFPNSLESDTKESFLENN